MTAERLADDYAPIFLSGVRIRRLRISFCPSSSSATPIGRASYWLKSAGGDAFEHLKQKAARGWLQRLVRLD